jgi:hypothetical protein
MFSGSFGTTRNSSNPSSWLRCELNSWGGYFCDAYDGSTYKSCSGSEPQIRTTLEALGNEDTISVGFPDEGTCEWVYVSKDSLSAPKAVGG